MTEVRLPQEVRLNAWSGAESPIGELSSGRRWGLARRASGSLAELQLLRPAPPDERDWRHADIGWGLVVADITDGDAAARARGDDLPPCLRLLCQQRAAPILRWRSDLNDGHLCRYYADGSEADLSVAGSRMGVGRQCIPKYLMIWGGPEEIPWRTQYVLNLTSFVGRLPLKGAALENYVNHMTTDWAGGAADALAPLVWSVDHGKPDMSWLMRGVIARPLWQKFAADNELSGRTLLDGQRATGEELAAALKAQRPGFVVTTSHGATGPTTDPAALVRRLGWLVDVNHTPVGEAALQPWAPDGAIWYAHACCSAGSDSPSRYEGLFSASDSVGSLLRAVAGAAGARTAPLAESLLSAEKPLKAWIGHVEPTFDWTLRDPANDQMLTHILVSSLYEQLYSERATLGWALHKVYREAGAFLALWQEALGQVNEGHAGAANAALYRQLVAMDRQSMVILGDPAVTLDLD